MKKILLFISLTLATLYLGVWYERYQPVGPELLPALQLDSEDSHWQSYGLQGAVIQESSEIVRLHSDDPAKSVGLKFIITEPSRFQYLRLSADLKTKNVVAGKKGWQKARLLLSSHDAQGKWLPLPHQVVTLEGNHPWKNYSEVFTISATAAQLRAGVQLPRATGTLWVKNLHLQEVTITPIYHYGRYVVFGLWGGFLFWLLFPYFQQSSRRFIRGGMLVVLVALFGGILLPGNLKMQVLAQLKHWVQVGTRLWDQGVSRETVQGVAVLPWFDITKLGHFFLFALLARVLVFACPIHRRRVLLLDLLMLAAATELLQLFVIGRSPLFTDWLIDTGGILLGLCCASKARQTALT